VTAAAGPPLTPEFKAKLALAVLREEETVPELARNRATAYYRPRSTPLDDLALMRLIDEIYTARPIYGSRNMSRSCRQTPPERSTS
jgi:hypothetical protein